MHIFYKIKLKYVIVSVLAVRYSLNANVLLSDMVVFFLLCIIVLLSYVSYTNLLPATHYLATKSHNKY